MSKRTSSLAYRDQLYVTNGIMNVSVYGEVGCSGFEP